ncbi:MAG TPA: type I DNA topoisomerase [Chloroflexota bacterium]|nr:type I DNA topoisomerase [Chloroflexota bacterium]
MASTPKKLVIVESPAKAKTIEKFLGRGYAVRASLGHVRDLPKRRLGVDVENGFEPTYVVPKEKKETVKELLSQVRGASELLLATDPDREGEAIAWHLTQAIMPKPPRASAKTATKKAKEQKPLRARRIVFHEITKNAVQEALKHPREIDANLVKAQQARRVIDRLVGYKLSPLLWNKVKKGLSAGRVQSVAVRLVVEREREIDAFVPEEYWSVEALLSKLEGDTTPFSTSLLEKNGDKLEPISGETANAAAEALRRATYTVAEVRQREVSRSPAAPFITSTLQQEASRRLGFTARRTMNIAQQLYEGLEVPGEGQVGLITYMRTDSPQVAQEAQGEARAMIGERYGPEYVPAEPRVYKARSKGAQEAHEAIRPTAIHRAPELLRGTLTNDQQRLYTLIYRRFVASQMENAVYDTTAADIHGVDGADTYLLRGNGSTLKFPGYLKVTGEPDEEEEARKKLPELVAGEKLNLEAVNPEQHFTQPPPRFTEATLIRALEEEGIGRPSTYAPIVATIQDRGYVERVERTLRPTDLGSIVNDLLVEHFPDVVDKSFTAQIEEHLDQVAEGEQDWVPVVQEFFEPFAKDLEKAASLMEKVEIADEPSDEVCECTGTCGDACVEAQQTAGTTACGKPMVIKLGRFGKFLACSGFPECRSTRTMVVRIGVNCPKCGNDVIEKKTRKGRTFYGCLSYPACDFASWQRPVPERCSVEGGLQVLQAGGRIVCTVCGRVTERNEEVIPEPPEPEEAESERVPIAV